METSVFQDINVTPEERLKAGQVNIQKSKIQPIDKSIKIQNKRKIIKKLAKLPKKKKRALLKRLLNKRLRIRKIRMPRHKTSVTFQPVKRHEVIKTRQPNEPSYYFKHSDNVPQGPNFIGKFRVK